MLGNAPILKRWLPTLALLGVAMLGAAVGATAPATAAPTPATSTMDDNPYGDPYLVSMFNGTSLDGWTANKAEGWTTKGGAIHSTGTGRGWLYYNTQVGSFRWIFNVRQVKGDHAPTVLIWGTTSPIRDALSAIQFQPPNGGHWDYRPGNNNSGSKYFKKVDHPKIDRKVWSQCELIGNHTTGIARMACCPLTAGSVTCKAFEVLQFKDPKAGVVGPLAIQIHNKGIEDEYKSLYVESPVVMTPDEFITTKDPADRG
jgi:hypothetical protein